MNKDYNIGEWVRKHPDFFTNSNKLKDFLILLKKVQHNLTNLTDFFIECHEQNKDVYSNPFFYDIRIINNKIGKWEDIVKKEYNNINHKYDIEKMDILQTGGYIYLFFGKLKDGLWFSYVDEQVYIYDENPVNEKENNTDEYEWHNQHLVDILKENKENKYFFEQMNNCIDKIVSEDNYSKEFHNHFEKNYHR